jgi:hypothetical protein
MTSYVDAASSKQDASGTTTNSTTSIAVTAGDLILIFSKFEGDGTSTTCTISDNAGGGTNVYTSRANKNHASANLWAWMHSAIAKASETLTFTQTFSAAQSFRNFHITVHRPTASTTFAYDNAIATDNSGTSTPSTGSFAVAGVGGAAMASFAEYNSGTWTQGTGWTERIDSAAYSETRILTNETTIDGTATWTATDSSIALAVAFKEESSAGPITDGPKLVSVRSNIRFN